MLDDLFSCNASSITAAVLNTMCMPESHMLVIMTHQYQKHPQEVAESLTIMAQHRKKASTAWIFANAAIKTDTREL
jgi:hypothetical protein